jgi:hypothetical protein
MKDDPTDPAAPLIEVLGRLIAREHVAQHRAAPPPEPALSTDPLGEGNAAAAKQVKPASPRRARSPGRRPSR